MKQAGPFSPSLNRLPPPEQLRLSDDESTAGTPRTRAALIDARDVQPAPPLFAPAAPAAAAASPPVAGFDSSSDSPATQERYPRNSVVPETPEKTPTAAQEQHKPEKDAPKTPPKRPAASADSGKAARVREWVEKFDADGDGVFHKAEVYNGVLNLVEQLIKEEQSSVLFRRMVIIQAVALVVLLACLAAMAAAIVYFAKDTKIVNGTIVNKYTGEPVMVQSADFVITPSGSLVSRVDLSATGGGSLAMRTYGIGLDNSSANASADALLANLTGGAPKPVPVSTAASSVPLTLHSALPMRVLQELKYLQINSSSGAQLNLFVQAVAKLPAPFEEGAYTSCEVLRVITYIGTITVHGSVLEFSTDDTSNVFREAGFVVTSGHGRRMTLSGVYSMIGFFNFVKDLDILNLPLNEPKPHIAPVFNMRVRVYEECAAPLNKTLDRCIDPDGNDRPGTTVQNGVRFMVSYLDVSRQDGFMLSTYEYPNVAPAGALVRKELYDEASNTLYAWQDLWQGTRFTHCEANSGMAPDMFSTLTKNSVVSFVFLGYELKLGVATRHFRLTTRQPIPNFDSSNSTSNSLYDVRLVDTDFWDTSDNGDICSISRNNYPVAFEMLHPIAGIFKIHVVSFTANITQQAQLFALPPRFKDVNSTDGCPGSRLTNVPRITDAYDPAWTSPPKDQLGSLFTLYTSIVGDGTQSDNVMQAFASADNSTATLLSGTDAPARRRAIAKPFGGLGGSVVGPSTLLVPLEDWEAFVAAITGHTCGNLSMGGREGRMLHGVSTTKTKQQRGLGPCDLGITRDGKWSLSGLDLTCRCQLPAFPLIGINGRLYIEFTYEPRFKCDFGGCLVVDVGLEGILNKIGAGSVARMIGIKNAQLMSICLSYDTGRSVGVLQGNIRFPNLLAVWLDWGARFEFNTDRCFSLTSATVKGQGKIGIGWFSVSKTFFDVQLASGPGCPPAITAASGSRYVRIRHSSGGCIDIADGSQYNSKKLRYSTCNSITTWQQFLVAPTGSGTYSIKTTSGRAVEVQDWKTNSGALIQMWDFGGGSSQLWRMIDVTSPSGFSMLKNLYSNMCIDLDNAAQPLAGGGSALVQRDCDANKRSQAWQLADW